MVGGFGMIAASWNDPSVLYAGGFGSLYRTDDCGLTWSHIPVDYLRGPSLGGVQPALGRDGTLYVRGWLRGLPCCDIFRASPTLAISRDGGANWEHGGQEGRLQVATGFIGPSWSHTPVVYLYASSVGAARRARTGLLRSDDAGITWSVLKGGVPTEYGLLVDTRDPDTMYAVTGPVSGPINKNDLLRSTDQGRTFVVITDLDPVLGESDYGLSLAMNATGSRLWLATHDDRIFVSQDLGTTWSFVAERPRQPEWADWFGYIQLAASPLDPNVLFVTTADGHLWVYRESAQSPAE
jgi:hypothetical protein